MRTHSPLVCVALATGMKCLPRSKVANARGNVLHDWHAEVLALRGFNRWLVDECARTKRDGSNSREDWIQRVQPSLGKSSKPTFALAKDVKVHMYCSEAPCGDASMELTIADQDVPTPWSDQEQDVTNNTSQSSLGNPRITEDMLGRGHFDRLGIVRRKPARPDAPPTNSKSCSDKLALKQCTGVTSSLTSLLIESIYLSTLVLPKERCVESAVERAWGRQGRMKDLVEFQTDRKRYAYRPFRVEKTDRRFEFRKMEGARASNIAVLALPHRIEVLINGVLQGRKQDDPNGACSVSRRQMWTSVQDMMRVEDMDLPEGSYGFVKSCDVLQERRQIKRAAYERALTPWIVNEGDDDWTLSH